MGGESRDRYVLVVKICSVLKQLEQKGIVAQHYKLDYTIQLKNLIGMTEDHR